jgi:hypothetical protein
VACLHDAGGKSAAASNEGAEDDSAERGTRTVFICIQSCRYCQQNQGVSIDCLSYFVVGQRKARSGRTVSGKLCPGARVGGVR